MQFCKKHWDDLRQGIIDRGMYHLVSQGEDKLVDRVQRESEGQMIIPDPLFMAHNMIVERSVKTLGVYVLMSKDSTANKGLTDENGIAEGNHYCPLCEAREHLPNHPQTNLPCDESWISTLLDYLKIEYEKEGWLKQN